MGGQQDKEEWKLNQFESTDNCRPEDIINECQQWEREVIRFEQQNLQYQQASPKIIESIKNKIIEKLLEIIQSYKLSDLKVTQRTQTEIELLKTKVQNINQHLKESRTLSENIDINLFYEIKSQKQEIDSLRERLSQIVKDDKKVQKEIYQELFFFLKGQKQPLLSPCSKKIELNQTHLLQNQQLRQPNRLINSVQRIQILELVQTKNLDPNSQAQEKVIITEKGVQNQPNFQKGFAIGGKRKDQNDPIDIQFEFLKVETQQFKIIFQDGF